MNLRLIPGWQRLAVIGLPVLVALGLVGGAYAYSVSMTATPAAAGAPPPALDVPPPAGLLVDVIGAVDSPGLYRMKRGDRVYDAIAAAGGLTPDADQTRLPDLAGRLKDGEQVKVPFRKGASGSTTSTRTNLNTATLEELETVPGFTPEFAQAVIDYRTNFGGFENIKELVDVLGMSEATFIVVRHYLTL